MQLNGLKICTPKHSTRKKMLVESMNFTGTSLLMIPVHAAKEKPGLIITNAPCPAQ